jgi:hypothetical protein
MRTVWRAEYEIPELGIQAGDMLVVVRSGRERRVTVGRTYGAAGLVSVLPHLPDFTLLQASPASAPLHRSPTVVRHRDRARRRSLRLVKDHQT